ncbi:hypothetical protein [Leptospira borgpetersenii]|uniref:hypothetical protein n=1 Tax=Leptospira borgpetersenii TaxID=174 RepID=UPI001D145135|nr:hypothetical protein [Leptospira borgpetersenii]
MKHLKVLSKANLLKEKSLETFIETGILGIYTSIVLFLIEAIHIQRTAYARGSFEI